MDKQNTKDIWINVHNDTIVRANGLIRSYVQEPRDPSVWTKTDNERRLLRNVKHRVKSSHFLGTPIRPSRVKAKLIVYLKSNKDFDKSTYSFVCSMARINEILSKFKVLNKKTKEYTSVISKYSYNNKTYSVKERPYYV